MKQLRVLALGLLLFGIAQPATVRFITPPNAEVGDQTVSGSLMIVTTNGAVTVSLTNTLVDPTSVGQNISGVFFKLSGGAETGSFANDGYGVQRWVRGDGTYYDSATPIVGNLGWALQWYTTGGTNRGFLLCVICPGASAPATPQHTQLGSPNSQGLYASANGSIATNTGHEPFLAGTSTFKLNIANVTSDTFATRANFYFGTSFGPKVGGDLDTYAAPEPAILLLLGSGLLVIGIMRRRHSALHKA